MNKRGAAEILEAIQGDYAEDKYAYSTAREALQFGIDSLRAKEASPKPPDGYPIEVRCFNEKDWVIGYACSKGLAWSKTAETAARKTMLWSQFSKWRYIPPLEWKEGTPCFAYFKSGACCFLTELCTIGLVLPDGGEIINVLTHEKWLEKEVDA